MKIKARRDFRVTLESLAFTDIILNIFIFFFTAFSLVYTFNPIKESKIIVKLPQADVKAPVDQTEPIVISINQRNEVFLKNKLKTLKDLRAELQSLIAFNKTRPVIVRADKDVAFERVVQVLDVVKNSGADRLGIAIEEKSSRSPSHP